jgi:hypothetical protein
MSVRMATSGRLAALDDGDQAVMGNAGSRFRPISSVPGDARGGVNFAVAELRVLVEPAAPFHHLRLGLGEPVGLVEGDLGGR